MPTAARRTTVVLSLVLLTGCASIQSPGARPEAGERATASPSPAAATPKPTKSSAAAPAAPPFPASAQIPDADGASALVTYFGQLMELAGKSGEITALAALSDDGCGTCSAIQQDLEQTRREGGHSEGGALHVVATTLLPAEGERTRVGVIAQHDASIAVIKNGSFTRVISRDAAMWTFRLVWTGAEWRVTSIVQTSPETAEALRNAQPGEVISAG